MALERSSSPESRTRSLLVCLFLLAGSGWSSWSPASARQGAATPGPAAQEIVAGMALSDALIELQRRGLEIVFSSRVVAPGLRVESTPDSAEPRGILAQLLTPHGLATTIGPEGVLVVTVMTSGVPGGRISGVVRSRRGGLPLAGVSIHRLPDGERDITNADGTFELAALEPGDHTLLASRPGYVVESFAVVATVNRAAEPVVLYLQPAPFAGDEIVVHPSRASVAHDDPGSAVQLDRDELLALPHLGNDVLRALELLPGVASNDLSAQFQVRGGRRDEVLILLDGQELFQGFHLQDFDNALSLVAASNLAGVRLTTGAFPADYGDRMGGVLDMSSVAPPNEPRFRLGFNLFTVELEASRPLPSGQGTWLLSTRRALLNLANDLIGGNQPEFWDLFGRLETRWGESQTLRLHLLAAADRWNLDEHEPDGDKRQSNEYDNSYLWLTHQAVLSERLFVDSAVSVSQNRHDRNNDEVDPDKRLFVRDLRDTEVAGFQQTWNLAAGSRHYLKAGAHYRRFDTEYDYDSTRRFANNLVELRSEPRDGRSAFRGRLVDEHLSAFVLDRFRPTDELAIEVGLRYDEHSLLDEGSASPRIHLSWAAGESSLLRASWGVYTQTQRTYELMVEDADSRFYPLERSEHLVLGWERQLAIGSRARLDAVRAEAYSLRVRDPRPRYQNLLEPFDPFPEGEHDRARIEPESGRSRGVELFVRGHFGEQIVWWFNYACAKSDDRIDGRDVPRLIDQRHTLNLDLDWRFASGWNLNLAWKLHTGRPTTPVGIEPVADEDGELVEIPAFGEINRRRLSGYHRLDLRVSREWRLERGHLTFHLDVQNLYDRQNLAGYSLELDEEEQEVVFVPETWPGVFASAGVSWRF